MSCSLYHSVMALWKEDACCYRWILAQPLEPLRKVDRAVVKVFSYEHIPAQVIFTYVSSQ